MHAHKYSYTHVCIPSLWRSALKRTGFTGEHIPYTLTRALFCLSCAFIPGVVSGRIDLWARFSHVELFRLLFSPSIPLTLSLSLALSKILKSMTRRGRARVVLFEQRVTFLAWRFPIEMLMKSDDPRTSRDAVIRDVGVATLRCSLLTQLLTADCGHKPIPCNRELCEF